MTILEIITKIESESKDHADTQNEINEQILLYIKEGNDCLENELEKVIASTGCPEISDVVVLADRQISIAGDAAFVEAWITTLFDQLSITTTGVKGALTSFPKDGADGTTLFSTVPDHGLSGSAVSLAVAAGAYTLEDNDGRCPADQAINAGVTELLGAGRVDTRGIIIILMTTASNFFDGYGGVATDPIIAANAARAAGYEVFVVSVTASVNPGELTGIAGAADRVFSVTAYEDLILTVDSIKSAICDETDPIQCLPDEPDLKELTKFNICGTTACCDEL